MFQKFGSTFNNQTTTHKHHKLALNIYHVNIVDTKLILSHLWNNSKYFMFIFIESWQ
jgi:hypothetical protein